MSSKISLWVGLIGIAATIPLVQPNIASAKTPVEIAKTARAITVLITEPDSVGSGVILQRQGDIYTVLTAAHVVKNKGKVVYKITTPDDRKHDIISSSIRSAPGSIDLAVVKFKSTTNYPLAKLGNCNILESGMDLFVAGFPAATRTINESVFVFREGKVTANSNKIFEKGYSLIYSNDTLPGMSGGAVLNSDGELVAIHGRGDRDDSGVKTGYNLGIPINRFATVASNMGVELGEQVAAIPQNTALKADDYFVSAAQKNDKRDYQGAFADYNRAIQINPNYANAYYNLANLKKNNLQDYQGALADYNRAIQINPNYADAYNNRGILKADKLQEIQGALADFNRAIQINPNLAGAYNNRGVLKKDNLQDYQGALADFNRLISLQQRTSNALEPKLLALAYQNRGGLKKQKLNDFQGALADYNQAIAINPNDADVYYNRGILKNDKLNDFQGALADYNQAISLNPKYAEAYNNRGVLKNDNLQDYQGALADFNKAIALNPKSALIYKNRGILKKQKLNDVQGALADYNQAIALNPNDADAYYNRCLLKKQKLNDVRGAISDMQQALKLYQQQGKQQDAQDAIAQIKKWRQTSNNSGF
ncbi:tetratricopeptide repeat protein [Chamaesiphon sp. VAR_48_metabat_403]|uniref:tetratricopeptide repeat protein n=1 Tax=Chamaesiphon sp. VAR_48_metabat_403 TaxID=2964700 RepID=UPI00286DA2C4|nr:tetratricopeptide repeat protein [Chamaesiphon sp. VAR_48_metabat_403]